MKFLYYPGCTLSTTAKQLDHYARQSAQALGFHLEDITDWQCCGAVFPLGTDEVAPKLAVIRALLQAQEKNLPLVTLCAACFHVFKQVNHQVKTDPAFMATVTAYDPDLQYQGDVQVLHYMEVLRDHIGFATIKEKITAPLTGRHIGAYYGCMMLRPSQVMAFDDPENPSIFEDFLSALGATPVVTPYRNECCGGYRQLKDKATYMQEKIRQSAQAKGAEALITACPLCQFSLHGDDMPVLYFTELLAQALNIPMEISSEGGPAHG